MEIKIIETSAEYYTVSCNNDTYRKIRHYNITFAINFKNRGFLKDIEPITIKIKEMPDSTKELKTLIYNEFAKIFQPKGD